MARTLAGAALLRECAAGGSMAQPEFQYPTIEDVIGRTPLVRLQRLPGADVAARGNVILGKLEGNNPAGSVKDRPAISMIRRAEERGDVKPGDTLIEATSGNTGIALAMAAAIKGYRMVLIMPEDLSIERAQEESFISHLVELRDRLLRSLIAIAVVLGVLCVYPGPGEIYDILAAPLTKALPEGTKMVAIGVITPFMVPLKVTAMVAFVLALPFILYQVWAFIAPGLYAHEKRLGIPLIISSTLLFMMGMSFCYFFVFGQVFSFIASFAPKSITPAPDIEAYLSFVLTMFLAFGIAFEVPVALVVLVKLGVVDVERLKEWRSYFIVGAFVVAAVVTPPDVVSQLALAIPMCLLYELGILASRMVSSPTVNTPGDAEMDAAEAQFRQ